jgi:hypothetical protein
MLALTRGMGAVDPCSSFSVGGLAPVTLCSSLSPADRSTSVARDSSNVRLVEGGARGFEIRLGEIADPREAHVETAVDGVVPSVGQVRVEIAGSFVDEDRSVPVAGGVLRNGEERES